MFTIRSHIFRLRAAVLVVVLAMTAAAASAGPRRDEPGNGGNPSVLPPGSSLFGRTYAEWSAEHWKWLLSIPAPINPANDFTGANGANGQSGQVWFLAGSFCPEPPTPCSNFTVTRNLTVPAGKALFFGSTHNSVITARSEPTGCRAGCSAERSST